VTEFVPRDEPDAEIVGLDGTVYGVGGYVEIDEALKVRIPEEIADPDSFKAAMSQLAAGVVMVTTMVNGRPWGLTVSACCSVSVDPPLVLVSLNRRTQSWKAIRDARRFGISILRLEQQPLAQLASAPGSPKFVDEFCVVDPTDVSRPPSIRGALYQLDCAVANTYEAGTHMLVVGRVRRAAPGSDERGRPLIYFDRDFYGLGDELPRV
jgi:flavin reductase ActVB